MKLRNLTLVLLVVTSTVCPTPSLADSSEGPTAAQRRAARTLSGKFRRARRNVGQQAQVLGEAMQTGPYAVEEIRKLIEFQLTPKVTRYRQQFFAIASEAAGKKFARADQAEVEQLRQQVNALRSDPQLSKDKIKSIGDPAMARLAELLLVDRVEILSSNRKLRDTRQQLLPTGKLWEMADAYLAQFADVTNGGANDGTAPQANQQATTFDQYLVQEEEIAVRLALPMSDGTRQVLATNQELSEKLDAEEARCVLSLNLTRILLGLEPLAIDLKLAAAARDHSHDMREHGFFAHDSPVPGKKTPWDRAARFGTKASGENIAAGYTTGPAANLAWFHSPGHHKNMLGKHRRVGVGREAKHWTELFGK